MQNVHSAMTLLKDKIAALHFVMSLLSQNARNAMTLLIDEIATAKAFAYAKRTQRNDVTT